MTVKRSGLGRNLSALLGNVDNAAALVENHPQGDLKKLSIDCLEPGKYQPRGEIEEPALLELSESIKKQGLLQPLVVRQLTPGRYEILAGERRWRACQLAGMKDVPVILRQVDDETAMAIGLVENLQREDLNGMDQARAMHRLTTEFSLTHQQVAELVSKSRAAVSNYLRLINLSITVQRMVENGDLDIGHARSLLMLNETQQNYVAQLVVAKNLSVRETEALVNRVKSGAASQSSAVEVDVLPLFEEKLLTLAQQLNTKVGLKQGKSGKGTLVIHYDDDHRLEQMIGMLLR